MPAGVPVDESKSRYKYYSRVCPAPGELDIGPVGSQSDRLTLFDVFDIGAEMVKDGLNGLRRKSRGFVVKLNQRRTDLGGKS